MLSYLTASSMGRHGGFSPFVEWPEALKLSARQVVKKVLPRRIMSPFAIALLLAWIAGFVDVTGYLVLSRIFSSHMSGNTVAAAAYLMQEKWHDFFRHFFPIPMFALGAFFGAVLGRAVRKEGFRSHFAPSLLMEAIMLGVFVGLTCRFKTPFGMPELRSFPLIALLAGTMGLQNTTLRFARQMAVRTTFISGMLVNLGEKAAGYFVRTWERRQASRQSPEQLARWDRRRRHDGLQALKYGLLWAGMFAGGVSGACLEMLWGTLPLLLPVAALLGLTIHDMARPLPNER